MADPITNENGDVAIKYLQTIPHVISVHGNEYAFVVRANINLTWVKPEDVLAVLAIRADCNCPSHQKKPKYVYANELDVQRWMA